MWHAQHSKSQLGWSCVCQRTYTMCFQVEKQLFSITSSTPTALIIHISWQLPRFYHQPGSLSHTWMASGLFPPKHPKHHKLEHEFTCSCSACSCSWIDATVGPSHPRHGQRIPPWHLFLLCNGHIQDISDTPLLTMATDTTSALALSLGFLSRQQPSYSVSWLFLLYLIYPPQLKINPSKINM